ncbi:MAG: molybdenum cofactor guanylyltransferase [Gammaproteobacteria bacterium]|nr:molybdenum cofactor guanylyltransferase [Gammaproteobacteria bacterium]
MGKTGITGIILAGGRGTRMGGRDKGLVALAGRPLAAHVVDRLRPQVDTIVISANRNRERYAGLGYPVAADAAPDFPGPLAGIASAGAVARTPWLLVTPCDTPRLPADLAQRLLEACAAGHRPLAVAHDGARLQPLFLLLRRELLADLAAFLAGGGRAVYRWLDSQQPARADFSDCPAAFGNLNAPGDDDRLAAHHTTEDTIHT